VAPDQPVSRPYGSGSASRPASPFPISWLPSLTSPDRPVARLHCSGSPGCPGSPVPVRPVAQAPRFRFARLPRLPGSGSPGCPDSPVPVRPVARTPRFRFARLPGLPGATRRPPVPDTRGKYRFPGLSRVPGEAPGWCSFPAVKVFLRVPRPPRKRLREFILSFFRVHTLSTELNRLSAYRSGFPLPYAQLIHR
jgi:hypothetical protein